MVFKKKKSGAATSGLKDENQSLGSLLSEGEEGQLTIDVFQGPGEFVIKSTVAGVDPEDLDISIDEDMVIIRGRREHDERVEEKNYLYQECFWGAFSRTVILPSAIDADKAQATVKNGILSIRLPKLEKTKATKLDVAQQGELD